jgi:mevalonate kinase
MPAISVSAPGKIILCGEHAVVYHQPAIAIPVGQVRTHTKIFAHPLAPKGEVKIMAESIGINGVLDDLSEKHPIRAALEIVKSRFALKTIPACEIRITSTIPISSD